MNIIPDAAIGTIAAALIAGLVTLLGLIISKEQKISEFRQSWIDSLRAELTLFLTQINAVHDTVKIKHKDYAAKVDALRPIYLQLNSSNFNILLRLNSSEENSQQVLTAMESFNALVANENDMTADAIRVIEAEFLKVSQDLLKSEWRRVKSGELTFKIAKISALAIVALSAILISVFFTHKLIDLGGSPHKAGSLETPHTTLSAKNG